MSRSKARHHTLVAGFSFSLVRLRDVRVSNVHDVYNSLRDKHLTHRSGGR